MKLTLSTMALLVALAACSSPAEKRAQLAACPYHQGEWVTKRVSNNRGLVTKVINCNAYNVDFGHYDPWPGTVYQAFELREPREGDWGAGID